MQFINEVVRTIHVHFGHNDNNAIKVFICLFIANKTGAHNTAKAA